MVRRRGQNECKNQFDTRSDFHNRNLRKMNVAKHNKKNIIDDDEKKSGILCSFRVHGVYIEKNHTSGTCDIHKRD